MKILLFTSEKLHGYLSISLALKPEITFLTGINGSGKTSAVRAMTSLLTPSITALANMSYASVSVTVENEGIVTVISSTRDESELQLRCSAAGPLTPLSVPILKPDAYESHNRFLERQRDFYREQEALHSHHPVLMAIQKLPTPMFLDLERKRQEGARARRESARYTHRALPVNPLAGTLIESLSDAEDLAEATYRTFLAGRSELTDSLKQELILSAFRQVRSEDQLNLWNQRPEFLSNLQMTEGIVIQSLLTIGISPEEIDRVVGEFFVHVREVAQKLPNEKDFATGKLTQEQIQTFQEWSALQPQVQQINLIANRIAKYNNSLRERFSTLERYLTSVNSFLGDSKKRLSFDEDGYLRVFVDEENEGRTISSLSSGERQLVVILTHLAFNRQAKRANILIIDEPELSLHLRWQELFVDALNNASQGLQLILATHSPSIIKGRITDCIDVEEARQDARLFA